MDKNVKHLEQELCRNNVVVMQVEHFERTTEWYSHQIIDNF